MYVTCACVCSKIDYFYTAVYINYYVRSITSLSPVKKKFYQKKNSTLFVAASKLLIAASSKKLSCKTIV